MLPVSAVCITIWKPNQMVPAIALQPILGIGEPFEHLVLDCVGQLSKTKFSHQYLLTLICIATHYIQTDEGANFMSKLFSQVITSLSIKQRMSSPYRSPKEQGVLERIHQMLKSLLTYCLEKTGMKDYLSSY